MPRLNSLIILRATRTLYVLVQCSCQVFLAKNLLLRGTTAILLRKILKIFRNLFPKPNKRIRRVNINRKIRRLGKHLNHLQLLYIRIPLYRYTSLYIGRGQVLFQNLFLTYPTPILGHIEGEFCERTKHRCYVSAPPSVAVLIRLFSFRTKF